jgi:hypothetical protein
MKYQFIIAFLTSLILGQFFILMGQNNYDWIHRKNYPCFIVLGVEFPKIGCGYAGPTAGLVWAKSLSTVKLKHKPIFADTLLITVACIEEIQPKLKPNDTISICCENNGRVSSENSPQANWHFNGTLNAEIKRGCISCGEKRNDQPDSLSIKSEELKKSINTKQIGK